MKKVVVIGGGTGSYTVLKGLKNHNLDIVAIVSMSDDGGSSGILRDEFGVLPPGDLRKCIVALSESTETMKEIFQYRFKNGCLQGHNLGNLLITALGDITGDYETAVEEVSKILNIKGQVLPVTFSNSRLCAELENGDIIVGETNIDIPKHDGNLKIKNIFLKPEATANMKAIDAISNADLIVIGPGDLYSSVLCNLVVKGVSDAIRNSNAKKVYICNLMTKFGETNNFMVSDFVKEIENYLGKGVLDYVIFNNSEMDANLLKQYENENAYPVRLDLEEASRLNVGIILENVITQPILIRHDSEKLANEILKILEK
ncbi:MAG: gluconeogenesis factor YvcK family protein [Candidatus Woesearchaeota archaeon]